MSEVTRHARWVYVTQSVADRLSCERLHNVLRARVPLAAQSLRALMSSRVRLQSRHHEHAAEVYCQGRYLSINMHILHQVRKTFKTCTTATIMNISAASPWPVPGVYCNYVQVHVQEVCLHTWEGHQPTGLIGRIVQRADSLWQQHRWVPGRHWAAVASQQRS